MSSRAGDATGPHRRAGGARVGGRRPAPRLRSAGVVDDFLVRLATKATTSAAGGRASRPSGLRDRYDELVRGLDSVYGPLFDLLHASPTSGVAAADVWGMCVSDQGTLRRGRAVACPHIQSWFFAFRRGPLVSEAFDRFWQGVEPLATKDDIIDRYEIGQVGAPCAAGLCGSPPSTTPARHRSRHSAN